MPRINYVELKTQRLEVEITEKKSSRSTLDDFVLMSNKLKKCFKWYYIYSQAVLCVCSSYILKSELNLCFTAVNYIFLRAVKFARALPPRCYLTIDEIRFPLDTRAAYKIFI